MLTLVNACASVIREGPASQEHAWPAYLGSARRASPDADTPNATPQAVWRASPARGITGGPAVSEDVIAVALTDRQVALLERSTGELLWRHRLGQNLGAGPLLADDRLFVAEQGPGGDVHALRLLDGGSLWSQHVGDVAAPLALSGGSLYAGSIEGWVFSLDPATGARRWRTRLSGAVRSAPLPVPGGLLVATGADSLFLLEILHGGVRQRRATRGTVLAAPALADSVVVIGTSAGHVEGLDPVTLESRWSLELGESVVGSIAVREGTAYALTGRGILALVPLQAPRDARRITLGLVARAGPAPVPGGVIVCGVNGEIVWADSAGATRWTTRLEPPVSEPVVVEGRTFYAVSGRGAVVAFR